MNGSCIKFYEEEVLVIAFFHASPHAVLVGVPNVRLYAVDKEYSCLVMDFLGPNIEQLFERCQRRFSLKTVLLVADQLVSLIILVDLVCFTVLFA